MRAHSKHNEHYIMHGQHVEIPNTASRAVALDVLRGLAILAMVLSGVIPYGQSELGMLPSWMYHAQDPPPTHVTNPALPGITWVDVVFPLFLFCLGAAIPLALGRRLDKGKWWSVVPGILSRGGLLVAFAIYRSHVNPYEMNASPTRHDWLVALAAFALVFPIWGRLPAGWKPPVQWLVRLLGIWLALVLLQSIRYPDGANLVWTRHGLLQWVQREDIIILVLANVFVAGSLIWLCTRNAWFARLAPVGLMVALRIAATTPGWAKNLWNATPADWLYRMEFMKYLIIVLPATIVGDMLVEWLRPRSHEKVKSQWELRRLVPLTLLLLAFIPVSVVGLHGRYTVETTLVIGAMLLAGAALIRRPLSELDKLTARLYQWGAYWLVLGLIFEPYEGGIKKSPTTMSYFFVTLGLAVLTLAALNLLVERLRGSKVLALLSDNGQNPMMAYIGIGNLILPLAVLTGLDSLLNRWMPGPWPGVGHAVLITLLLALVVSAATRAKVFLRA